MIEILRMNNKEQNLIKPSSNEDQVIKRAKSSSILIEESAPK